MIYEWFQNIEFKYIWVLPFLLMLPVIAFIHYRTKKKSALLVSTSNAFKVKTFKNTLIHFPFILRLLALGCVILALARPQLVSSSSKNKGEGIDIVLCMDVSGSMLSSDFYPNRLSVAKDMAIEFVESRPVDQIGLVIFSGESFTQFPLSTDHQSLIIQISGVKSGVLEDGTVIGEGLATAVDRLSTSKSKSKVIILLTDGKEEAPETRLIDPYTALEIAKAKGVKVYTIGMSAQDPSSAAGAGKVFVDEALLKRIANQTGGEYFRATDKESLQGIYQRIDRLEKSEIEVVTNTKFDEQFVYFIAAALLFLLIEVVLRYSLLRTFP